MGEKTDLLVIVELFGRPDAHAALQMTSQLVPNAKGKEDKFSGKENLLAAPQDARLHAQVSDRGIPGGGAHAGGGVRGLESRPLSAFYCRAWPSKRTNAGLRSARSEEHTSEL